MLDRVDAAFFLMWVGISAIPLVAINAFFRCLSFRPKSYFWSAWWVWLAWVVSSTAVFFISVFVISRWGIREELPPLELFFGVFAAMFAVSFIGVAFSMRTVVNMPSNLQGKELPVALVTNMVAWTSGFAGFVLSGYLFSLLEQLFPPASPFAIY